MFWPLPAQSVGGGPEGGSGLLERGRRAGAKQECWDWMQGLWGSPGINKGQP